MISKNDALNNLSCAQTILIANSFGLSEPTMCTVAYPEDECNNYDMALHINCPDREDIYALVVRVYEGDTPCDRYSVYIVAEGIHQDDSPYRNVWESYDTPLSGLVPYLLGVFMFWRP